MVRLSATDADERTFGSSAYDLTREGDVAKMHQKLKPSVVIHLAARVGASGANRENSGRSFYENAIRGIHMVEHAR